MIIGTTQDEDKNGYRQHEEQIHDGIKDEEVGVIEQQDPAAEPLVQSELQQPNLPTLEEAHKLFVPTVTRIPKSARGDYARALADVLVCHWAAAALLPSLNFNYYRCWHRM